MTGLPVRLSFPKGEHQDVIVPPGETTIGSAPDNAVVVQAEGVQPHHATIVVDNRGFTLFVKNADAWTHVNARPVREKAILRLGDVVSLNSVNIVLKPDSDQSIKPAAAHGSNGAELVSQTPAKAVLRAISGPYFGKVIPVRGRLTIGRGADCDLVLEEPEMGAKHATIEVFPQEIHLHDHGSARGTLVNGVAVRDAMLHSGDQIAFDRNRFLVEAPGMPLRKPEATPVVAPAPASAHATGVTQTMRAIRVEDKPAEKPVTPPSGTPAPAPVPETEDDVSLWWLIGAGALIALGIALLLLGIRTT